MVETYGVDQERIYYILESVKGTTPANPAMLSVPHESIDPGMDVGNIALRAGGNFDVVALKKGTRNPTLKVTYPLPSAAPIELLQHAKRDIDSTLSVQVLYHKGVFATATDIISLLYTYMRISKASVSCEIDDVVRATLEMVGQQMATGTAKIAGATYTDHVGAVAFNESSVTIAGAVSDQVVGWKFDILNNPRQVPVIRTGASAVLAKYVPFGKRQLTGEIKFEFESKAQMDVMLADTAQDIAFGLGTGTATFTGCKWANIHHEKWLDDLVAVTAQFEATGLTIA